MQSHWLSAAGFRSLAACFSTISKFLWWLAMWDGVIDFFRFIKNLREGRFCRNPADFGLEPNREEILFENLNYGMTTFSTIYNAFFTVIHFFAMIGWTSNTYNVNFIWKCFLIFINSIGEPLILWFVQFILLQW